LGALYYESQPDKLASGFGERSERLGVWGGGVAKQVRFSSLSCCSGCQIGFFLQGNVPGRKWVTVGIDSPLVRDIGLK